MLVEFARNRVPQLEELATAAEAQLQWRLGPVRLLWRQEIRDVLFSEREYGLKQSFAHSAGHSHRHLALFYSRDACPEMGTSSEGLFSGGVLDLLNARAK